MELVRRRAKLGTAIRAFDLSPLKGVAKTGRLHWSWSLVILVVLGVLSIGIAGCGVQEKSASDSSVPEGEPEDQESDDLRDTEELGTMAEFVVIEESFHRPGPPPAGGWQRHYHRAIVSEDGELMLLEAPGQTSDGMILRRNSDESGFLSSMTFFVGDNEFTMEVRDGWLVGVSREQIHLAGKTVHIIHSGQKAVFVGHRRDTSRADFPGVPVFSASDAHLVDP